MNYQETLDYLYQSLPMFQRVGQSAFKKDLTNTLALCKYLGNPERKFRSIHVAGTNGKGSTSHSLAAVLQAAGYKVGLYTSPHLKEFTERIRINGQEVSEDFVVNFVGNHQVFIEQLKPSFFELTVGMAFEAFAQEAVDIAVIEVGMGGRLDSTNVIDPILSVITSIGYDHMAFLGDTLPAIAGEKAGIIKYQRPVVISLDQPEVREVFDQKASMMQSDIYHAIDFFEVQKIGQENGFSKYQVFDKQNILQLKELVFGLNGNYQRMNLPGILTACYLLQKLGYNISLEAIQHGLAEVVHLTGLKGRWQVLQNQPIMICDTGHNEAGIKEVLTQLDTYQYHKLHLVIGMVQDKDVKSVLMLLPKAANYYFCQAKIPRAMPAENLKVLAAEYELVGKAYQDVETAINAAKSEAQADDLIFIGGSTFVVAEIPDL